MLADNLHDCIQIRRVFSAGERNADNLRNVADVTAIGVWVGFEFFHVVAVAKIAAQRFDAPEPFFFGVGVVVNFRIGRQDFLVGGVLFGGRRAEQI